MWNVVEIKNEIGRADGFTVTSLKMSASVAARTWNSTIREMAQDLADARNAGDDRDSDVIFTELGWYSADGRELIDLRVSRCQTAA